MFFVLFSFFFFFFFVRFLNKLNWLICFFLCLCFLSLGSEFPLELYPGHHPRLESFPFGGLYFLKVGILFRMDYRRRLTVWLGWNPAVFRAENAHPATHADSSAGLGRGPTTAPETHLTECLSRKMPQNRRVATSSRRPGAQGPFFKIIPVVKQLSSL